MKLWPEGGAFVLFGVRASSDDGCMLRNPWFWVSVGLVVLLLILGLAGVAVVALGGARAPG
jgi:hypothetical protein